MKSDEYSINTTLINLQHQRLIFPQQPELQTLGNTEIFAHRKTAFLCSRKYPAGAVLRIYDWAQEVRDAGECVISGFHSHLERDVFDILLNGRQPIILADARRLSKRYPDKIKKAIDDERLLVVSPFPASVTRVTSNTARKRNEFMVSAAERVVVGHMSQDGMLSEILSQVAPDKEIIRLNEA